MLKIGVIGLGFASTLTLPDIARDRRFKITAAADPRAVARAAFERDFGGTVFDEVEALCASPDVDLVYITTPPTLHREHAVLAAANNKHILLEKPMALTVEDCDRIVDAADAAGVALIYGHTHCYDPPIRAMRAIADSGDYGAVRMVHSANYNDILYRARAAWELDTSRGGGVVFNQAPHQIDIARTLIAEPLESVHARAFVLDPGRPTEGAFSALLSFQNGAIASLIYGGYGRFDTAELHYWVGEDGWPRDPATNAQSHAARAGRDEEAAREARRYGHAELVHDDPPHQPFFGLTIVTLDRLDIRQSADGLKLYDTDGVRELDVALRPSGREIMLDEVYNAVNGTAPARHDGRWGRETVAACVGLLTSSATGATVTLTPEHKD